MRSKDIHALSAEELAHWESLIEPVYDPTYDGRDHVEYPQDPDVLAETVVRQARGGFQDEDGSVSGEVRDRVPIRHQVNPADLDDPLTWLTYEEPPDYELLARRLLRRLDRREQVALRMRCGFGRGGREGTQEEIAGALGLSRQTVSDIQNDALRKLRGWLTEDDYALVEELLGLNEAA